MTKKTFEIVVVLVGLILGSLATINTSMTATQIVYTSNQDVKVEIVNGNSVITQANIQGKSLLPLHYENGVFYFSPTLSLDDLVSDNRVSENYIFSNKTLKASKNVDNCYLQVELVIAGEDEINEAIRLLVKIGQDSYVLSKDNPTALTNLLLTTNNSISSQFTLWYELADESITVDNLNNSEGADIQINLYAYVEE